MIYCHSHYCYIKAVTFLEYWKRKNASLAHHWDVLDFEDEEVSCFLCPYFLLAEITI